MTLIGRTVCEEGEGGEQEQVFYDKGSELDPSLKTFVDAQKDKVQVEQVISLVS